MSVEKCDFLYWKYVFKNWRISTKLINNRDQKFVLKFWKTIFDQCGIFLKMIIAYHFFANDQAKRTNQIVKTTLQCLLVNEYEKKMKKKSFFTWNMFLTRSKLDSREFLRLKHYMTSNRAMHWWKSFAKNFWTQKWIFWKSNDRYAMT